ncbi:MAG TPA: hypothetical protein VMZ30_21810 [Pyrinomonadaceae bacterium]|nr:hypothetical protein [Pyrinomonadaceae bacterium]
MEWIDYKNGLPKSKRLSNQSVQKLFDRVIKWTDAELIESVEASISNGWQGLFPPRQQFGRKQLTGATAEDHAKGF